MISVLAEHPDESAILDVSFYRIAKVNSRFAVETPNHWLGWFETKVEAMLIVDALYEAHSQGCDAAGWS